jgi:hypothetical protein
MIKENLCRLLPLSKRPPRRGEITMERGVRVLRKCCIIKGEINLSTKRVRELQ